MKILVRTPNWIGDSCISLGFLRSLEESTAGELFLLAARRVAPLFKGFGKIVEFSGRKELFQRSLSLRKAGFDLCFVLPPSLSSAISASLACSGERIGPAGEPGRRFFLTRALKFDPHKKRHLLIEYLDLLRAGGFTPDFHLPALRFEDRETEWARDFLVKKGVDPSKTVAIAPFAAYGSAKEWGIERYLELAGKLLDKGLKVVVMGGSSDRARSAPFEGLRGCLNLVGKLSLRESAALLRHMLLLVGNDSGATHLAACAGTKVIAIFGSTSPRWTGPLGEGHRVIYKALPCSPCFKRECPLGTRECMKSIRVDEVLEAVLEAVGS